MQDARSGNSQHHELLSLALPVSALSMVWYDTYFGGVAFNFSATENISILLCWQSDLAFDLKDSLAKALETLAQHTKLSQQQTRSVSAVAQFPQFDLNSITGDSSVRKWTVHPRRDDIVLIAHTVTGKKHTLSLPIELTEEMQDLLQQTFDATYLIDLRSYRTMGWPEMSKVFETKRGLELRQRVDAFEFSIEVFRRNTTALVEHIKSMSGPLDDELIRWDRRFQRDLSLRDAIHFVFNFVAAAKALVDHSRCFYRKLYESERLLPEYQAEIDKRFSKNGLVLFVHQLRDLMMHTGLIALPIAKLSMQWKASLAP